jgi:hypothetical protein
MHHVGDAQIDLFRNERDFVGSVKFGIVIRRRHSKLEHMASRFQAIQCSFRSLEHAGHFAVDVSVYVLANFALRELKLERNRISFDHLS